MNKEYDYDAVRLRRPQYADMWGEHARCPVGINYTCTSTQLRDTITLAHSTLVETIHVVLSVHEIATDKSSIQKCITYTVYSSDVTVSFIRF